MSSRVPWLLLLLLSTGCSASTTGTESQRYRGDYTWGHEVNNFCPAINSQCYWLGPDTSQALRDQLKALYEQKRSGLYKPVCMIVEGYIDRETPRDGFAADYDGLITITALEGACTGNAAVVPSDLNHRRWVLSAIDGRAIDAADLPAVLDFGERLFVEGSEGCQRFNGFAELSGNRIKFDKVEFDHSGCSAGDLATTLFRDRSAWRARLVGDALVLSDGVAHLAFTPDDWR